MAWTWRERENILLQHAHEGYAYCPADGNCLVEEHQSTEFVALATALYCPGCGERLSGAGDLSSEPMGRAVSAAR